MKTRPHIETANPKSVATVKQKLTSFLKASLITSLGALTSIYFVNRPGFIQPLPESAQEISLKNRDTSYALLQEQTILRYNSQQPFALITDENIQHLPTEDKPSQEELASIGKEFVVRVKVREKLLLTRFWYFPLNQDGSVVRISLPGTGGDVTQDFARQQFDWYQHLPLNNKQVYSGILLLPNFISVSTVGAQAGDRHWSSPLKIFPTLNAQSEVLRTVIETAKTLVQNSHHQEEIVGFSYAALLARGSTTEETKRLILTEQPRTDFRNIIDLVRVYFESMNQPGQSARDFFLGTYWSPWRKAEEKLTLESLRKSPPLPSSLIQSQSWLEKEGERFLITQDIATLAKGLNVVWQGLLLTSHGQTIAERFNVQLEYRFSTLSNLAELSFPDTEERGAWFARLRTLLASNNVKGLQKEFSTVSGSILIGLKKIFPNAHEIKVVADARQGHTIWLLNNSGFTPEEERYIFELALWRSR